MSLSLNRMLENYRISPITGFAMDHPSPTGFKNATLSPWVDLATQIPLLLKSNNLRSRVDALPILSPDHLDPESIDEYRLAFVLLTFLSQAYIWGNIDSDTPSSTLPASISVPLTQISRDLEIQPAFCYAASSIWLYTEDPIDKKPYCMCSFTGTADEEHFNIMTHNVERTAGKALIQGLTAARCAGMKNKEGTKVHLERVAEILRDCRTALADIRNGCDPDVFYFKLRPYLVGSQAVPGGVLYQAGPHSEEGDGTGVTYSFPGPGAAQSSIFQAFDLILGISHASNPERAKSVEEMRNLMPGHHARFLGDLKSLPSIPQFLASIHPDEEADLKGAYNKAVKALTTFRSEHVQIITLYILSPSKRSPELVDGDQNAPMQAPEISSLY